MIGGNFISLWQHFQNITNITKTLPKLNSKFIRPKINRFKGNKKYSNNSNGRSQEVCLSIFQEKPTKEHDEAYKLIRAGDVETNPGPGPENQDHVRVNKEGKENVQILTYNCRGLKDYKKLKRILNTSAGLIKKERLSIILLQETHLGREAEGRLKLMWRGNFILSPGEGRSRGCLTLLDSTWQIAEKIESLDGRMAGVVIKNELTSLIIVNLYAPNDHDIDFFEGVFNTLIELKDKYPEHEVVIAGDLNLVLDPDKDSVNRVDTAQERISRTLLKENCKILELEDAYRSKNKEGGYSWYRGNVFSRLDYIFVSRQLMSYVTEVTLNWAFDKSDHAAVGVQLGIPNVNKRGPGLIRVNAEILKTDYVKREFEVRIKDQIKEIPTNWNPNKKLEFLKVATRSIMGELLSKIKKIDDNEYKSNLRTAKLSQKESCRMHEKRNCNSKSGRNN